MEHERFDQIVAAGATNGDGFTADDVAWLLENAPGEILILRPAKKVSKSVGRLRNQSRDHRVRRVFLRVPQHAENEAPVA